MFAIIIIIIIIIKANFGVYNRLFKNFTGYIAYYL